MPRFARSTPAASGIGLAIVRALLNEGMNVVIADKSLSNHGDRVIGIGCDVSLREDIESAAARAFATFVAPRALAGPYAAAKFGVVGLSEVMAAELEGTNAGVSVLCPGMIRTQMVRSGRNRPQRFGGGFSLEDDLENSERSARYLADSFAGLDPDTVPPLVLRAIRENRLYIFTHREHRGLVEARFARIRAGFDALGP